MKVTPLGNNQTQLDVDHTLTILFSYKDPVAAIDHGEYFSRDLETVSTTTARHIEHWLDKQPNYNGTHTIRSKEWFEQLAEYEVIK